MEKKHEHEVRTNVSIWAIGDNEKTIQDEEGNTPEVWDQEGLSRKGFLTEVIDYQHSKRRYGPGAPKESEKDDEKHE